MSDTKKVHEGRNIKRFREIMGIKQEGLAWELGEEWSQKRVSLLEQKESIDRQVLEQVAAALKVPVEAIQNFDEDKVINIISNTFTSNDTSTLNAVNPNSTFNINPLEKWLESLTEIKRLNAEIIRVKDEQIAAQKEQIVLLKEIVKK